MSYKRDQHEKNVFTWQYGKTYCIIREVGLQRRRERYAEFRKPLFREHLGLGGRIWLSIGEGVRFDYR